MFEEVNLRGSLFPSIKRAFHIEGDVCTSDPSDSTLSITRSPFLDWHGYNAKYSRLKATQPHCLSNVFLSSRLKTKSRNMTHSDETCLWYGYCQAWQEWLQLHHRWQERYIWEDNMRHVENHSIMPNDTPWCVYVWWIVKKSVVFKKLLHHLYKSANKIKILIKQNGFAGFSLLFVRIVVFSPALSWFKNCQFVRHIQMATTFQNSSLLFGGQFHFFFLIFTPHLQKVRILWLNSCFRPCAKQQCIICAIA